jgi:hypothetical protein
VSELLELLPPYTALLVDHLPDDTPLCDREDVEYVNPAGNLVDGGPIGDPQCLRTTTVTTRTDCACTAVEYMKAAHKMPNIFLRIAELLACLRVVLQTNGR